MDEGIEFSDSPKPRKYVCIKYLYAHAEAHVNHESVDDTVDTVLQIISTIII